MSSHKPVPHKKALQTQGSIFSPAKGIGLPAVNTFQKKEADPGNPAYPVVQRKANTTGLPDSLKSGMENMSGVSLDSVKVHYNSSQPAQLNALAYAKGSDIHLAPGQEKHLPHETWHVVQQKQGRVKATLQMKTGVPVNNEAHLEKEADVMGAKATGFAARKPAQLFSPPLRNGIVQGAFTDRQINEKLGELDIEGENFSIPEFLEWQGKIEGLKPAYRTMGPEFEFAKINVEGLPVHVELGKSDNMINGLPFVIETDAGSVIEIACPPFVVATLLDSFPTAQKRSMIIASKFETALKSMANEGMESGKDLDWLFRGLCELFRINIAGTELLSTYKDAKLGVFTKGVKDFTNKDVNASEMTNSQINLKMTTDEVGHALRKGTKGKSANQFLKGMMTAWLFGGLKKAFMDPENPDKYRNRVAIIAYYTAQIPMMALQFIMNELRSQHMARTKETKEQNREAFKLSHPSNQKLLISLSKVKDYLGFWIKSSLNDMMRDDPEIKQMVMAIPKGKLISLMIARTNGLWEKQKPGLELYSQLKLGNAYSSTIEKIVINLEALARTENIPKPKKASFPNLKKGGSNELINYAEGAPFMARPDTYVPLDEGHLTEIRGMNKRVADNPYLKGFQMPHFRKTGTLADEHSPNYYPEKIKSKL